MTGNVLRPTVKGKEEYLYTAFIQRLVSKRSDMDHTVLPANYTMPDGASTKCGGEHMIAAHYSFINPETMTSFRLIS